MNYLKDLTAHLINNNGLCKVFFARKEGIYIKHVLKRYFVCGDNSELQEHLLLLLKGLNMDLFGYMQYVSLKLRSIYKYPRELDLGVDAKYTIKSDMSYGRLFQHYRYLSPLLIFDFDGVITNPRFRDTVFRYLLNDRKFRIMVLTANGGVNVKNYLQKHGFSANNVKVIQRYGKSKKIIALKDIALKNHKKVIFYFDNEDVYLEYGNLLFLHPFKVKKNGKIKKHNNFK